MAAVPAIPVVNISTTTSLLIHSHSIQINSPNFNSDWSVLECSVYFILEEPFRFMR